MSVPFKLHEVNQLPNGNLFLEWSTIADDGLLLREGNEFEPCGLHDLSTCVVHFTQDVKERREKLNMQKKAERRPRPDRGRPLSDAAVLVEQLSEGELIDPKQEAKEAFLRSTMERLQEKEKAKQLKDA